MSYILSASAGAAGPERKQNSRCFSTVLGSSLCTRSPSLFPACLRRPVHGTVGDALAPCEAHVGTIVYLAAQTHSQHICLAFKSFKVFTSSYSCGEDRNPDAQCGMAVKKNPILQYLLLVRRRHHGTRFIQLRIPHTLMPVFFL